MDQPLSPLPPPLDPSKLREMVVDKQQSAATPHQQTNWTQAGASNISPASVDSTHSGANQRVSSASTDVNSPFQQPRPTSISQQSFEFNNPRTPMCQHPQQMPPTPTKPMMTQSHMMSPMGQSQMPPASPFQRSSSAASNSCPSPYNQAPNPQYSQMYQPGVRMPQTYSNTTNVMQQQYPNYPGGTPQWAGQNVSTNQHYMVPPQQRMPYNTGYQTVMPPPSPAQQMMFSRPNRPPSNTQTSAQPNPLLNYPNVGKPTQSQQPQTPSGIGTPPIPQQQIPLSPYQNQPPNQNYNYIQQQRLQQLQSPIRSPFMSGQQASGQSNQQMAAPGTPTGSHSGARYGTPQQSAYLQSEVGPQTPSTPLSQQRFSGSIPSGQVPNGGHQQLTPSNSSTNMRSPPLVSPAQAQIPPHQMRAIPPTMQPILHPQLQQQHSMDMSRGMMPNGPTTPMANRPIAPPGYPGAIQSQTSMLGPCPPNANLMRMGAPVRLPPYCTQVFQLMSQRSYPVQDLFLAGCVFFFDETVTIPDPSDLHARLRYYGAEVETNISLSHNQQITHLVSEHLNSKARSLLKYPIRSVTPTWLSDTLSRRKMDLPSRAAHLPTPWSDNQHPAIDKLISSEGFTDSEVVSIRALCKRVGAQYTSYFTSKHAALISKSENGQKSHQASEWKTPILNYGWLVRLYFGNVQVINEIGRDVHRPPGDPLSVVDAGAYGLERIGELCLKLLHPWRYAIVVNDDIMNRALATRQQIENDTSIFAYKKLKQHLPAPTEEQITEAQEILRKNNKVTDVRIYIDGMPETIADQLKRKARFLGAQLSESITECTHYVVPSLKRTPNLLEALARGRDIVDPLWIEQSFRNLHFLDTFDFYTCDSAEERRHRFNALNTVYRAREHPVFEEIVFHLGPSVQFSVDVVRRLIEAAGGTVELSKPTYKKIAEHIRYDKTFLIVINESDTMDYSYLFDKRIPIFNEELVFMSILRHHIDTSNTFRFNPPIVSDTHTNKTPSSGVKIGRQPKMEQKLTA